MNQYRVKCFLFVKADNKDEAETTAGALIEASSRKDGGGVLVQAVIRSGSAKLIEENRKEKAA